MGNQNITIKDVAKMCGVGVSTVSRAMNDHPDISEETKDKIKQAIRDCNYIPNNSARNLKSSDTHSIAVLIKGITNPFFSKMIQVFEREIQKKKYTFILQHVDECQNEIDVAIELEKEKRLNGIVFLGGCFSQSEEKLKQISVPFVLSTVGLTEGSIKKKYSSVSVDDVKESYRLVEYLIKNGHKKIAVICSCEDDESIGKLRLEGYQKALLDYHIPFDPALLCHITARNDVYTMKNGYWAAQKLLASQNKFTAIYAISDSLAIGACRALTDAGKHIPNDYSVAGFDGLDIGSYYNPVLTTIQQPVAQLAEETIRILFHLIKNKKSVQQRLLEGELFIGESVKKCPE